MAEFAKGLPGEARLKDDRPVWRYMEFTKFAAMVLHSEIFMTRADRFEDLFEGAVSREAFEIHMARLEKDFELANQHSPQRRERDRVREREMMLNRFREGRKSAYISCWYAGESESDAMWKVYGGGDQSIAVQSTVGRLLTELPENILLLPIQYLPPEEARLPEDHRVWQFAFKRPAYSFESELRCVMFCASAGPSEYGRPIKIEPISRLIDRVIVNPRSMGWFRETARELVSRLGLQVHVHDSAMDQIPWWDYE